MPDKDIVSAFLNNARSILETAEAASRQHQDPADVTIVVRADGGLHLVCQPTDWSMPRLEWEHGVTMSYRVKHSAGQVRVEGRSAGQLCILESDSAATARRLLGGWPKYLLPAPVE